MRSLVALGMIRFVLVGSLVACGGNAVFDGEGGGTTTTTGTGANDTTAGTGVTTAVSEPGCDDPSGVDLTGPWAGTWQTSDGVRGTWNAEFSQDEGGNLTGAQTVEGTACGRDSQIEGQVDDACNVTFGVVNVGACDVDFSGSLEESGDAMGGTFVLQGDAAVNGTWSGQRMR